MKNLIIKPGNISGSLMDMLRYPINLKRVSNHADKLGILILLQHLTNAMQETGWYEHTSDWDPYIELKLSSGDIISSESGYEEFDLVKDGEIVEIGSYIESQPDTHPTHIRIQIENPDEGDQDENPTINKDILIEDIKTININD